MKRLLQYPLPQGNPGEHVNTLALSDPEKAALLALRFFCVPIKGKNISEKESKFLLDSEHSRYKVPDIVIGHSFGGLSASYCFGKPEQFSVKKLILLAAPSRLSTTFDNFYNSQGFNQIARDAISSTFEEVFGFEILYFTTADFVKNISASGLIIHDEHDPIVPIEEVKIVHQYWQGSELVITQNLGHSLQAPSVFRKILKFCKD